MAGRGVVMPAPGPSPCGGHGEDSFSTHSTKDWLLSEMRAAAQRSLELQLEQQDRLIARFLDRSLLGVRHAPSGPAPYEESPDTGAQKDARPASQALVLGRLPVEPDLSSSSSRPKTADLDEALKNGEHGLAPAWSSDAVDAVDAALSRSHSSPSKQRMQAVLSSSSTGDHPRAGHKFHIDPKDAKEIHQRRNSPSTRIKSRSVRVRSVDSLRLAKGIWEGEFRVHEPERSGVLASFLTNSKFQYLCAFVIVFNGLIAIISANNAVQDLDALHGQPASSRSSDTFFIFETTFLCFYAFELVLKLMVHRWYFFVNKDMGHNIFDLTIVLIDGLGLCLSLVAGTIAIDVSFLRSLRVFKVTRMLRVLRAFEVFTDLRVLLEAMTSSVMSLLWCGLVIVFTLCIFSLLLLQVVTDYLGQNFELASMTDCGDPKGCQDEQLLEYFGSIQRSMLSLYMSSTGGENWTILYHLLEPIGMLPALAFVIFTFLYQFGMFNLLTSMFVDRTMKIQLKDRETKIIEQRCREADQTKELLELLKDLDHDEDGKIDFQEFQLVMEDPATLTYLAFLGLPIADVKAFFDMLVAESHGELQEDHAVPIDLFVQGCMRMKGMATSIDMQALKYQTTMLAENLQRLEMLFLASHGQSVKRPKSSSLDPWYDFDMSI